MINELLPELGPAGFGTGGMGSTFADLFTKKILEKGMPELKGQYTSRGLEGSTAESRGYNDLLTQAITQGIFSGQDLVRSNVGALEGGLQEAFNRLLGITQEGRALNQQKFDLQTANANRQTTADVYNVAADVKRRGAETDQFANLSGLGGLLAFAPKGGGGGMDVGGQALGSTLSKTGGATSGGGSRSWGDVGKDPDTWLKVAQIASMLMASCWVAAVLFNGFYKPETVRVRNYILFASNGKFRNFYIKYGKQIAEVIKGNRIMKEILRPIFEEMAERGRLWMEAYNGRQ